MVTHTKLVYVPLYRPFITIVTCQLPDRTPDPAPILHRFFVVPRDSGRNMPFCHKSEGSFSAPLPRPSHRRGSGVQRAQPGYPDTASIYKCHGERQRPGPVRPALEVRENQFRGLLPGRLMSGTGSTRRTTRPHPVPRGPAGNHVPPAHFVIQYMVTAMAVLTGSWDGMTGTTAEIPSAMSFFVIVTYSQVRPISSAAMRARARSWDPSIPTATHGLRAMAATSAESTPPERL